MAESTGDRTDASAVQRLNRLLVILFLGWSVLVAGSWVWHVVQTGGHAGAPGGPEGSAAVGKDTADRRLGTVDLGYGLMWAAGTAGLWTAGRRFRAGVLERNIALEIARRNEQVARESRAMLQLVMNTIPARVFWKDRNSVYLGCNVLFARDAGLSTPEEIIGRTDFELGWREQAELYRADDRLVMESGIPKLRYEEPQTTPTGDRIYLRTSKVPLRDENGRVIGIMGTYEDITERKLAREALERERAFLRQIIDTAPGFICVKDAESRFVLANRSLAEAYGTTVDDLLGKSDADFNADPEEVAKFNRDDREVIETRLPKYINEERITYADGQTHWITTTKIPLVDPDGTCSRLLAVCTDITERKRTEEALEKTEALLTAAIQQSPSGILIADAPDVTIRVANPAALGIRGRTTAPLTGIDYREHSRNWKVLRPDGSPYPSEELPLSRAVLEGAVSENVEAIIVNEDGRKRWVSVNAGPIRNREGRVTAGIVIFSDVTDRKQVEAERESLLRELETKNQELESLLHAASHDMRSPLVNIQGFVRELEEECARLAACLAEIDMPAHLRKTCDSIFGESIPTAVRFIRTSGEKMNSLINGMLKVSRSGRTLLHLESLDMAHLLDAVIASLSFQIREASARVEVDPLPDCRGDVGQINQVFTNLLDNAMKYRDPARPLRIRISGRSEGRRVVYCVEDNGRGIAPEHQSGVWDLFYRLNPREDAEGEGVGLTLVRRIVERHNGQVWLESEPGKGSRFFVALPAAE